MFCVNLASTRLFPLQKKFINVKGFLALGDKHYIFSNAA